MHRFERNSTSWTPLAPCTSGFFADDHFAFGWYDGVDCNGFAVVFGIVIFSAIHGYDRRHNIARTTHYTQGIVEFGAVQSIGGQINACKFFAKGVAVVFDRNLSLCNGGGTEVSDFNRWNYVGSGQKADDIVDIRYRCIFGCAGVSRVRITYIIYVERAAIDWKQVHGR